MGFNDSSILNFDTILRYLIFGLCSYQLYFLVLLLWFYLLMPLWIKLVKAMTIPKLSILFIFQIFFDYYSEYLSKLHFNFEFFKEPPTQTPVWVGGERINTVHTF